MFSKIKSLFKSKIIEEYSQGSIEKPSQPMKPGEDGVPKPPATTTTIKTYVSGIKLEDRHEKLKKLIAELKKEKYFKELYDGLSNKNIIEEEFGSFDEEDPVYELSGKTLPHVRISVSDASEDIGVYVGKGAEHEFMLGVLPEDGAKRVLKRLESADLHAIEARLSGGKYKYLDDDDKVKTGEKNYNLQLKLKFMKK
jgi:hypothetical protein